MRCPKCKSMNDRVSNSRYKDSGASIRRRRECLDCGERWTTYEIIAEAVDNTVTNDLLDILDGGAA